MRQSSGNTLIRSKKKALLASLDELVERMPSLLDIDHPCAQRQIADARRVVEVCSLFTSCYLFILFLNIFVHFLFVGMNQSFLVVWLHTN